MSLRYRLILAIALMLLVSLLLGGGLAWLHAVRSVATEMDAALEVGEHTVRTVIPYMDRQGDDAAQLRQLIVNENGIDPVRLVPILHYDGSPITARFIAGAIGDHQDQLKVTPLRKVKS